MQNLEQSQTDQCQLSTSTFLSHLIHILLCDSNLQWQRVSLWPFSAFMFGTLCKPMVSRHEIGTTAQRFCWRPYLMSWCFLPPLKLRSSPRFVWNSSVDRVAPDVTRVRIHACLLQTVNSQSLLSKQIADLNAVMSTRAPDVLTLECSENTKKTQKNCSKN